MSRGAGPRVPAAREVGDATRISRGGPGGPRRPSFVASPRAPWLYGALLLVCRGILGALRFRLELRGAEHLPRASDGRPAGGWIAAGLPHRTWIDPFVLALLLPLEPRIVFLGDARTMTRSPLRRALLRAIGGVVPIWPGGGPTAFDAHVAIAAGVVERGAIFALFPEVGPPVPIGTARPLSPGIGYIALRTGAPVVPLVLGGTHELYLRRHIVLQVLPPCDPRELAGLAPTAPYPVRGSRAEREAAHRIAAALHERTAATVEEAWRAAEPRPGSARAWRWLTGILH